MPLAVQAGLSIDSPDWKLKHLRLPAHLLAHTLRLLQSFEISKKSLLNIVNKKDSFCFLYCIAAALFSFVGSPFRPKSHMKNIEKLNFDPKQMPMPLSGIRSFEMRNKCSINVYQLEDNKLINIYSSKNKKSRRRVDLLRLVNGNRSHYCLIKNFSNIIHHLSRSPKKREAGPKSRFCRNCYQPIAKQNMQRHLKFCETNAPLEIVMPGQDRVVEFVNWQKTTMSFYGIR